MRLLTTLALAATTALPAVAVNEEFEAAYGDTTSLEEGAGVPWVCGAEDAWILKKFDIRFRSDLKFRMRNVHLVVGHHEGAPSWAFVMPEKPVKLSSDLRGNGEMIRHLLIRFHPSRFDELFRARDIKGPGNRRAHAWALYAFEHKGNDFWSTGRFPELPEENLALFDITTMKGMRRSFVVDLDAGRVEYNSRLQSDTMPVPKEVTAKEATAVIDSAWSAVDDNYAYFAERPEVDWFSGRSEYKKRASKEAHTELDTAIVVRDMLAELGDPGLRVRFGRSGLPGLEERREILPSFDAVAALTGPLRPTKSQTLYTHTAQDMGYIAIMDLEHPKVVEDFDSIMLSLGPTWSLVLDLRWTIDGPREHAEKIGGRFMREPTPYGSVLPRDEDGALGDPEELVAPRRGPWPYRAPVYVLVGRHTAGGGERLAQILSVAPEATILGERTLGAGYGGEWAKVGHDIVVYVPSTYDLDLEDDPVHGKGVVPEVELEATYADFDGENDPFLKETLDRVLETPVGERRPGR
jgi:hypothetical protein